MTKEYLVYLEELKKRSLSVLIVFGIGLLGGFLFSSKLLTICLHVFNFSGVNVMMTSPVQLIDLSIYTAILTGFMLATPVFIYELLCFTRSAISEKEHRLIKKMLPIALLLFVIGAIFGAWVTQFIIAVYSRFSLEFQISNMWDIQKFFNQVVITAFLMGLIFQMPLVLTILIRFGLVKRKVLVSSRKYVYVIIVIVAVLLPTTDVLSLVFETLPLLFLFEIALLLNRNY